MCIAPPRQALMAPVTSSIRAAKHPRQQRRRARPVSPDQPPPTSSSADAQKNYHDHAKDTPPSLVQYQQEEMCRNSNSKETAPFLMKLWDMLHQAPINGFEDIVSWQPHGRCFIIHKPKELVSKILPLYLPRMSKLASFHRQLNLYGFQRITQGKDKGSYYHELFLRGKAFLAHRMKRCKVNGKKVRGKSHPEQEPNLWAMEWVGVVSSSCDSRDLPRQQETLSRPQEAEQQETAPVQLLCEWGQAFYALDTLDLIITPEEEERPLNMEFEHTLESDLTLNAMFSQAIEQQLGEEDDDDKTHDNDFAQMLDNVISWS